MAKMPIELERQITKLATLSQEVYALKKLLRQWFARRGYITKRFDGNINNLLIDMYVEDRDPKIIIELIKQEMQDIDNKYVLAQVDNFNNGGADHE